MTRIVGSFFVSMLFLCITAFAQTLPDGGGCTNCPPYTNNFVPTSYVPGLKLAIPPVSGTNLHLNLLEADPAGKYDIYFESNLASASWSDILQGTNGQTNFTFLQSGGGFFRVARRIIIANLTPGTNYSIRIRAIGGSTGSGDWSDPVSHMAM